jgi:predicted small lipoprotein YifL
LFLKVAGPIGLIILFSSMTKLATTVLLIAALIVVLSGCASQGPSPEQQTREAEQQRQAERQQAEFRKGLPPVSNPGQGW